MTQAVTPSTIDPIALDTLRPKAFAFAIISVTDLNAALALWQDRFGMTVLARREGAGAGGMPGAARRGGTHRIRTGPLAVVH